MGLISRRLVSLSVYLLVAALAAGALGAASALAAGDANQASCTNEAMDGFRSYLPDCRAYEMVSPPFKEGGAAGIQLTVISADGSRVGSLVNGAFAGADTAAYQNGYYEFERHASGWSAIAVSPPASSYPNSFAGTGSSGPLIAGSDLSASLWTAATLPSADGEAEEELYLEPGPGAPLSLIGPEQPRPSTGGHFERASTVVGASRDLSHVLVSLVTPRQAAIEKGLNRPWPGDTTAPASNSLYEYDGVGNLEPVLVGVSNQGVLSGSPHINEGAQLIGQCGVELGSGNSEEHGDAYNAVSADGRMVFFTPNKLANGGCERPAPKVAELYVRIGGAHTLALSEPPLAVPGRSCTGVCREDEGEENGHERSGGYFAGASEDGSKVFLTTAQPLVDADENTGEDLYEERIENGAVVGLTQLSHASSSGEAAEVQGVVRVSEDGSHVYFVAKGVLTNAPNREGKSPVKGADNLYVYESGASGAAQGRLVFVGTLLSEAEEAALRGEEEAERALISEEANKILFEAFARAQQATEAGEGGRAEAIIFQAFQEYGAFFKATVGTRGPSGTLETDQSVWEKHDEHAAQATPDGRFLVFASSAHLTGAEDTSRTAQLFEYDAQSEALKRVSVGQGGFNHDGNISTGAYAPQIPKPRYAGSDQATAAGTGLAVSDDGSRVFFESRAGLTPQATAGVNDVYEYRDGDVYLISGGHDASRAENKKSVALLGTDGSGEDVFFSTADPLVRQDGDTQVDIYDARQGGGFAGQASYSACVGDGCQGQFGAPLAPPVPASGAVTPEAPPHGSAPATKGKPRPKRLTAAQKLARALRACQRRPVKQRAACRRAARRHAGKSTANGRSK